MLLQFLFTAVCEVINSYICACIIMMHNQVSSHLEILRAPEILDFIDKMQFFDGILVGIL